jgi:hypothetical protein
MTMAKKRPPAKHPIQPMEKDEHGVLRFKRNKIVDFLASGRLNELAAMDFPAEDWEQLAQLIGYSHSGSPSYVRDEVWYAAQSIYDKGMTEQDARIEYLEKRLRLAQKGMRKGVAALFGMHENDLKQDE